MRDFSPNTLRRHIIETAYRAGAIHIPSALSIVEILSELFGGTMHWDATKDERDVLVLSKGHGVLALYACALEAGWLLQSHLDNYLKDGTKLFGLSDCHAPACEVSSGSLGHGLPIAVGMALGLKRQRSGRRVFCIVGDGEMQAGPCLEAIQFADHHRLNLQVIVDANGFQALGRVRDILPPKDFSDRPWLTVRETIKGHGIPFMEHNNAWHYTPLNESYYREAMAALHPGSGAV